MAFIIIISILFFIIGVLSTLLILVKTNFGTLVVHTDKDTNKVNYNFEVDSLDGLRYRKFIFIKLKNV